MLALLRRICYSIYEVIIMRNMNSYLQEQAVMRRCRPQLSYDTVEAFELWQRRAKEKLMELLGLPLESCPLEVETDYQQSHEDFEEYRFTVQTEPGYFVPCHLLVPHLGKEKYPVTVCLSGHCTGMHIALGRAKSEEDQKSLDEWHHRAIALRSVKEGRCALVIEARNFGETSVEGYGISCTESAKNAILMGRTVIGCRIWDAMRALDVLEAHFPQADLGNIVATGNSGGGTAAYYLACMDQRITAAAPSCSICDFEYSIAAMPHCLCNHIPYIRKFFEMGDLAGLIAPRKLVIAAGREDPIFPFDGTLRTYENIQRLYKAAGAEECCALVVGDQGHLNYADLLWEKLHRMGI